MPRSPASVYKHDPKICLDPSSTQNPDFHHHSLPGQTQPKELIHDLQNARPPMRLRTQTWKKDELMR